LPSSDSFILANNLSLLELKLGPFDGIYYSPNDPLNLFGCWI